MKIFFYSNAKLFDNKAGITKKVLAQIEALRELGHEVYYTAYIEEGAAIFDNENNIQFVEKYRFLSKKWSRFFRRSILLKATILFLKTYNINFDVAYLRYHYFDFKYLKMLKILKQRHVKIVLELHSTPTKKLDFSLKSLILIIDSILSKRVHKYIDLVAAMAKENNIYGVKTIEIENVANLVDIPVKKKKIKVDNTIVMISLAYESIVHGLDRIISSINNYKNNGGRYDFRVYFVGTHLKSTIKLAKNSLNPNYYQFINPLVGEKLDMLFEMSHIAIGSLANHRILSFYGSALKTKEYLARGIPLIYGWNEKILANFKYGFKVELNEENINIDGLINFITECEKQNNLENSIRKHIDIDIKWSDQFQLILMELKLL